MSFDCLRGLCLLECLSKMAHEVSLLDDTLLPMGYIGRMLLRVFKVFGLVEVCTLSFTQLMPVLLRMRRMLRTSLPKPKLVTSGNRMRANALLCPCSRTLLEYTLISCAFYDVYDLHCSKWVKFLLG